MGNTAQYEAWYASERQEMLKKGWGLTEEEMQLVAKTLSEMRISSKGEWASGACVMARVNRFDSFGKAGVRDGDTLVALDSNPITNEGGFALALAKLGIGNKAVLQVRRADKLIDLNLEILKKKLNLEIDEMQVDFERKISP